MRATILNRAFLFIGLTSAVTAAGASANGSQANAAEFARLLHTETSLHVGETLPAGVMVTHNGMQVDLRSVLHGPVALVKLESGCSPCQDLLQFAKSHASEYNRLQGASLAILMTQTSIVADRFEGAGFDFYTTSSDVETGFLAGKIMPTIFFFDEQLRLIARHPGLTSPEESLQFPNQN